MPHVTTDLLHPPRRSRRSSGARARPPGWSRFSFAALLGLLVWAPLPLGSNRDAWLGLLASLIWATLVVRVVAPAPWRHGRRLWGPLRAGAWPLTALSLYCLLVAAQWLSPDGGLLGTQDTFLTGGYLLRCVTYTGFFALVLLCVDTPQRIATLLAALVAGGVLQAVLAVALFSGHGHYVFLFTEFEQGHRAMGTFPNPDHLAGYLELTLSAGLGLMLARLGGAEHGSEGGAAAAGPAARAQQAVAALRFLMSAKMRLRLMLIVMVVALVMTRSRMGNGAFFLALLVMGAGVALRSAQWRRPALWLVLSMALVDGVVIGQWVGLDRVLDRLHGTAESTSLDAQAAEGPGTGLLPLSELRTEESIQDRLRIPLLSMPLVAQSPWFGHGGGTYLLALPPIKPPGFPHYWTNAHNDYVEVAVDTGLVGLALLLAVPAAAAWRALRLLDDRQPRLVRGAAVATLTGLCCMALHSLVDFNLQIPANALTLVTLCALPWAACAAGTRHAPPAAAAPPPPDSR